MSPLREGGSRADPLGHRGPSRGRVLRAQGCQGRLRHLVAGPAAPGQQACGMGEAVTFERWIGLIPRTFILVNLALSQVHSLLTGRCLMKAILRQLGVRERGA